ncbi:MAG: hypothetical protein HY225_03120 [Candidatus Vogelbacteria bacterium]|nr:hypothetical protein [Candidatus Vogelbacteria bacterium]
MADKTFKVIRGQTFVTDGWGGDSRKEKDNEMYLRVNRRLQKWLGTFDEGGTSANSTPRIRHFDYIVEPDEKSGKNELVLRIDYDSLSIDGDVCESLTDDDEDDAEILDPDLIED